MPLLLSCFVKGNLMFRFGAVFILFVESVIYLFQVTHKK